MKTADPELMRAINRFHVMDAIRRHGPISRVELSSRTDLSPTTISAITAALLDDGLIIPRRLGAIGDAGRGRPRVMLELNRDAARVVGVKIAARRIVYALTDFQGEVLATRTDETRSLRQNAEGIADLVERGIRALVASAGLDLGTIAQVCIALPGTVEHDSGLVRHSPILKEGPADFGAAMAQRLPCPTLIESDANAALVAQHWFRACRDLDDFLVVSLEDTIGLAIMHGGEIYRGARGLSFDLGSLAIEGAGGPGTRRLADALRPVLPAGRSESDRLVEAFGQGALAGSIAVPAHETETARAGEALGLALAHLVTVFAPPRILLTGTPLALGEAFTSSLTTTLQGVLPPWLSGICDVVVDAAEDGIWAQGAAGAALRQLYGAPWGTTGPARRSDRQGRNA